MTSPVSLSYTSKPGYTDIWAGRFQLNPGNCRLALGGQSNCGGRAGINDVVTIPQLAADVELATYMSGTFDRVYINGGLSYVKLNTTNNRAGALGQFGPEFGLAVRWMRETQSGNLYIDKHGPSGVKISTFDYALDGSNYTTLSSIRKYMNQWLVAQGITVKDVGFIWVQGESNYTDSEASYQTSMQNVINQLYSTSNPNNTSLATADTKIVLMQMAQGSAQYGVGVAQAKQIIADGNPSIISAPSTLLYMNSDNLHQNGRGQVNIGYTAFTHVFNTNPVVI